MATETNDFLDILPLYGGETEEVIYARWVGWANEGLTPEDVDEWIDTREGSHFFVFTAPMKREVARAYDLMGTEVPASTMPLWSWGGYLDDIAAGYLVERNAATPAKGFVTFLGKELTIVAGARVGTELGSEEATPKEYEVTEGGSTADPLGGPENLKSSVENEGGGMADGDHFYVVTTVNAEGESTASAVKKVTVAAGGDGIVKLTWDAVAGATGYRVFRGALVGGPFDFVGDTEVAELKDDGVPAPDNTIHPPAEDTTGDRITLPVEAVTTGVGTNAAAGEVTVQLSSIGADSITNAELIRGGTDPETDESLREKLLARFEGKGPGNKHDYEVWSLSYGEGIGRVVVIPLWAGDNTVLIIALTESGDPVSEAAVEGLKAFLDPVAGKGEGQAPVGHNVTVTTAEAVEIDVDAKVEFEDGYSLDGAGGTVAMRDEITAAVREYVETAEPGNEVVRQKVIGRISSFAGVHDVDGGLTLNGKAENVALEANPAQVGTLGTLTLEEEDV